MIDFQLAMKYRKFVAITAAALPLCACNSGAYNKSLMGQINQLKQEVQKLQEENRLLLLKLEEAQIRYGINFEQINPEQRNQGSIFERVYTDIENKDSQ